MAGEDGGALLESGKLAGWVEEVLPEIITDNDDAKEAMSDLVTFIEALIETEKLTAASSVDDIAKAKPKFEAEIAEILESKTEPFVARLASFLTAAVEARAPKPPADPHPAPAAGTSAVANHTGHTGLPTQPTHPDHNHQQHQQAQMHQPHNNHQPLQQHHPHQHPQYPHQPHPHQLQPHQLQPHQQLQPLQQPHQQHFSRGRGRGRGGHRGGALNGGTGPGPHLPPPPLPNALPGLFGNLMPLPGANVTPEMNQMMAAMAAVAAAAGVVPPSGGPPPPAEGIPLVTNNRTIHVSNIPDDKFNIMEIASYFGKFGTVSNVKLSSQPTKKYAFIEFSTPAEATAAFRNPEAVFANRFIKVGWANNAAPTVTDVGSRGGRGRGRGGDRGDRGGRGRGRGGSSAGSSHADQADPHNAAVARAIAAASSFTPVTSATQPIPGADSASPPDAEAGAGTAAGPTPASAAVPEEPQESPEQVNARKRREILEMRESQKKQKTEQASEQKPPAALTIAQQLAEKNMLMASIDTATTPEEKSTLMNRLRELMTSLSVAMEAERSTQAALVAAKIEKKKKEIVQLGYNPETGAPQRGGRGGWRGRGRGGRGGGSLDLRTRTVRIVPANKEQALIDEKELRGKIFDIEELERVDDGWNLRLGSRRSAEFVHDRGNQALSGNYEMSWVDSRQPQAARQNGPGSEPNGADETKSAVTAGASAPEGLPAGE